MEGPWLAALSRGENWAIGAKVFISIMALAGTCVLAYGAINPTSKNIAQFICYLLIAMLAARLKVRLPGITGTMSVNFLFILLGILELGFTETLVLGTARNPGPMLLSRSPQSHSGHVQPVRQRDFHRCGLSPCITWPYPGHR